MFHWALAHQGVGLICLGFGRVLLGGFGTIVAVSTVDFGRSIMLFDFISSVVPPLRPFLDSVVDQFVDSGNWLDYR